MKIQKNVIIDIDSIYTNSGLNKFKIEEIVDTIKDDCYLVFISSKFSEISEILITFDVNPQKHKFWFIRPKTFDGNIKHGKMEKYQNLFYFIEMQIFKGSNSKNEKQHTYELYNCDFISEKGLNEFVIIANQKLTKLIEE